MVIPHSYGKNCSTLAPGAAVNKSDALLCPDRTDCENLNNDALLMSGYLCHPCLPSICDADKICVNIPYEGAKCDVPPLITTAEPTSVPTLAPTSNPSAEAAADDEAVEVEPVESVSLAMKGCLLILFSLAG
jgi:hypothetical protein